MEQTFLIKRNKQKFVSFNRHIAQQVQSEHAQIKATIAASRASALDQKRKSYMDKRDKKQRSYSLVMKKNDHMVFQNNENYQSRIKQKYQNALELEEMTRKMEEEEQRLMSRLNNTMSKEKDLTKQLNETKGLFTRNLELSRMEP